LVLRRQRSPRPLRATVCDGRSWKPTLASAEFHSQMFGHSLSRRVAIIPVWCGGRDNSGAHLWPGAVGELGRVCAPGSAGNCSVQGSVGKGQPGHPPVVLPTGAADAATAAAAAAEGGGTVAVRVGVSVGGGSSFLGCRSSPHFAAR